MKMYALLNNRNQVIGRGNMLDLLHQSEQSKQLCNLAVFRPNEKVGRVVASFDDGFKVKLPVNTLVNESVLGGGGG